MTGDRFKGRAAAGTGDPEDLTGTQATVLLDVFTSMPNGLPPAGGGGMANFLRAEGTWAAPPGRGGSGSVVGPTSAADNALARFDGGTGKLIQTSGILLTDANEMLFPAVASPAAPSAGNLHRFAQNVGGRILPAFRGPTGLDRAIQPFLGRGRVSRWAPAGGNTTIGLDGVGTTVASGTATARVPTPTRLFTSVRRLGYVSAAVAGSSCGAITHNQLVFWRGNAAGLGGFHALFIFGVSDAAAVADARLFAGLYSSAAAIGNVNPSTLLNLVGVGCDNGQTTLRIMTNDGAGAATAIDLGANFPSNTLSTDMYELALYAPPNGASIDYRVTRLNTGDVATGSLATDLPVNTQFLCPQVWRNNGATALAAGIDIANVYVETDT
jgi:hypothetical protein